MNTSKTLLLGGLATLLSLSACSKSDDSNGFVNPTVSTANHFHVALASGSGSLSATTLQGFPSLGSGVAIKAGIGQRLESSRTARIFPSQDRNTIYSLNYTVGTIEKLSYQGGDQYTQTDKVDTQVTLGARTVRFTKINDQIGSVHYITAKPDMDGTTYKGHTMELSIGILDLATLKFREGAIRKATPVTLSPELTAQGYYVSRIDAPVLSGGKLYCGCALTKADLNNPTRRTDVDKAVTLVVDFADLSKAEFVFAQHDIIGSTNGYRTPTQHLTEDGSILQLVSGKQSNGKQEVRFARLRNGAYDASFTPSLSALLGGKETRSDGFFYAGNGIAYVPYEDFSLDKLQIGVDPDGNPTYSAAWKLARVDFNKGTAIDLEVPEGLWLRQYQSSVVRDGKFYIALAPIGRAGNVYIFDVASESPKGELGATLEGTSSEQYFIGIY